MKRLHLFVLSLLVASLVLSLFPVLVKNIKSSFQLQPNNIPRLRVSYEDHSFVFSLTLRNHQTFYIRVRPFIVFGGEYYGMTKILNYLEQNYPNISYKKVLQKLKSAVHYGFNLTQIPSQVADKIDLIGFKLVDLSFPLSAFELEEVELYEEDGTPYNVTRIHIPKANLCFSFEDLYPWGYSVENVNSTHVLVGNVTGRENLYLDPVILSNDVIIVTGGLEGSELDFDDIYNADRAGRFQLLSPRNTSNSPLSYNETRYSIDYYQTVNGLTAFELGFIQLPPAYTNSTDGNATLLNGRWGIRVWKRHINQTETEITSGVPVAQVNRSTASSGLQSVLWNCPQTSLEVTDSIVVRAYVNITNLLDWTLMTYCTFTTFRLSGVSLLASTWNVTYYTWVLFDVGVYKYRFSFGSTTYNQSIQNFAWTYFNSSSLDYDPRPADDLALKLNVTITNLTVSGNVTINGQDKDGEDQTETIDVTANASYITTLWWSNVSVSGVVCCGNFTIEVWQERWGLVWKQSDTQYAFDAALQWGNGTIAGTTYFKDTVKQITFNEGITSVSYQTVLDVKDYVWLTLGTLVDADEKTTKDGCTFIFEEPTYNINVQFSKANTHLYECAFYTLGNRRTFFHFQGRAYNCIFDGHYYIRTGSTGDFFNCFITDTTYAISRPVAATQIDRLTVVESLIAMEFAFSGSQTYRNIYARENTYVFRANSLYADSENWAINVDSDTWTTFWGGDNHNARVYRQYEFDLNVTDAAGDPRLNANVTIFYYGQGGGSVGSWLTYANGSIDTQTLSMGYYNQSGGNSLFSNNPFNLTITMDGYQTYSKNFTLSEQTSWEIALTGEVALVGFSSTWFLAGGTVGIIFGVMLILLVVKKKRDLGGSE